MHETDANELMTMIAAFESSVRHSLSSGQMSAGLLIDSCTDGTFLRLQRINNSFERVMYTLEEFALIASAALARPRQAVWRPHRLSYVATSLQRVIALARSLLPSDCTVRIVVRPRIASGEVSRVVSSDLRLMELGVLKLVQDALWHCRDGTAVRVGASLSGVELVYRCSYQPLADAARRDVTLFAGCALQPIEVAREVAATLDGSVATREGLRGRRVHELRVPLRTP